MNAFKTAKEDFDETRGKFDLTNQVSAIYTNLKPFGDQWNS